MPRKWGSSKAGFTLLDLLVVTSLSMLLLGLLAPAVAQVRQADERTKCANNLRMIGIASHNLHDASDGLLPPLVGDFHSVLGGTFFFNLLAYIEEDVLFRSTYDPTAENPNFAVWRNDAWSKPIKNLTCPADTSHGKQPVFDDWLATSSYAANTQVFGRVDAQGQPISLQGSAKIPASFPDGTSNTIMFAERYRMCDGHPCAWGYPGTYFWTPMFAYYSTGKFQHRPAPQDCDPALAQTSHERGIQVCLGDASVRTLNPKLSAETWWAACTPAGGEILGNDW